MKYLISALMIWLCSAGSLAGTEADKLFPPRPAWQPEFSVPIDKVLERMVFYTNASADIAIFENGTAVVLPNGLSDEQAEERARQILSAIFFAHPDFKPLNMKDGNILVSYNFPAYNVVFNEFAEQHMDAIRENHLDALATDEVLITGAGPNKFDEFGMKALYGRTFMFMDAQSLKVVKLFRHTPAEN